MDKQLCCSFNENKVQLVIGNAMMISTTFLKLERKIKIEQISSTGPNSRVSIQPRVENAQGGEVYLKSFALHWLFSSFTKSWLAFFVCKTYPPSNFVGEMSEKMKGSIAFCLYIGCIGTPDILVSLLPTLFYCMTKMRWRNYSILFSSND